MQERKTGTGGAYSPLSEILRYARVARFNQDDEKNDGAGVAADAQQPNP
jgi:hypothetical protein